MPTKITEHSDEELMQLYRQGDQRAFAEIYRRYSPRIYAFLRRRVQPKEYIEDIYQNIFMKIHKSREAYSTRYLLSQWVFVITRTVMLDFLAKEKRKAGKQVEIGDDMLQMPDQACNASQDAVLAAESVMGEMAASQKKALELRVLEDYSYEEIAAKLGLSQSNARQLVSRGLRQLRSMLAKPKMTKEDLHES